ncbi:MAG: branched-chain amino acid ABC transporter permease [Pseudomonadota bacterium]
MAQETHTPGLMDLDAASRKKRDIINTYKRRFRRHDAIAAAIFFALLFLTPALPGVKGWMVSEASLVVIYVIAAMGISILVGYIGLVSVGHGGFLAIGAYTSALLTKYYAVDLVVGIIAGMLVSAFIGAILALVFLRLSGAFMAIGTLGFAFFVGTVVNNVPIFEGRDGILLPDNVALGMEIGDFGFYYVSIVSLALVTIFVFCIVNSGTGRAFMALRDSENAAMASGVNRLFYRTLAFSISAGITGIAGALNAHIVNYVSAEVYADIWFSVDILMAVVVGGPAILFGPYLGGLFVVMLPFFLEELADFAFILKGVVLILVLRFAQAGVAEVLLRPIQNLRRRKLLEVARGAK